MYMMYVYMSTILLCVRFQPSENLSLRPFLHVLVNVCIIYIYNMSLLSFFQKLDHYLHKVTSLENDQAHFQFRLEKAASLNYEVKQLSQEFQVLGVVLFVIIYFGI